MGSPEGYKEIQACLPEVSALVDAGEESVNARDLKAAVAIHGKQPQAHKEILGD